MRRDRTSRRTAVITTALLLTAGAGTGTSRGESLISSEGGSTDAGSPHRAAGAVPLSAARVLVATCKGNESGLGAQRLALRVYDDQGQSNMLGWTRVVEYGYVDTASGCQDVADRIDATGHWLVAVDTPTRRLDHGETPDYRTVTDINIYNLRKHTGRTLFRRKVIKFDAPRLVRPNNVAVFTNGRVKKALTVPGGRRTAVPTIPRPRAREGRCDYAKPGVVLADGRRVNLPRTSECLDVLGWLSPTELAVAVAKDSDDPDLQTLFLLDPQTLTAREIAPAPGYDPNRHGAIFNVSFTKGAISGGTAFLWVRAMHFRGDDLTRLREDIWAVGSHSRPRRVARFISTGPAFTDVASITAWPLVP